MQRGDRRSDRVETSRQSQQWADEEAASATHAATDGTPACVDVAHSMFVCCCRLCRSLLVC